MSELVSSLEEDRFLISYSFLRMLLLLLGGSLVNALYLAFFGITVTQFNFITLATDLRVLLAWVVVYPILWAIFTTYALPAKLRVSPFDLAVATSLMLVPIYLVLPGNLSANWISLTSLNGALIIMASLLQTFIVSSIVGLGKAGGLPYHYDSFLLRGRSVTDFRKVYDSEQYRDWLSLPILEVVPRGALVPECIILSSSKNDPLGIYVFFSNNKRGLLVQIISFEKGKYSIFKSKNAIFNGEQIKRTILWEIGTHAPVPFVVQAERDAAEHYALRVTRSITAVRDLQKRDQIVLSAGVAILTLEYFLWAFNIIASAESYAGYSILTAFGIIAELSYRRLRDTRIWEKITRKTTSFGARPEQESKT